MISYLKGKIVVAKTGLAIIDVNNVGYGVKISSQLVLRNSEAVEFFIHEHIREDCNDLYGFSTFEELELFEKLISVNGVGPKAGMNIMSAANPAKIISSIANEDVSFFTSISGIGKKAAAKIIVDLKSKITNDKSISVLGKMNDSDDVLDALISLGYKKVEVNSLIGKIPTEISSVEHKITWCLKNIGK